MYLYFLSFSGENGCWTHFFINIDIMLVIMHYALFICHYAVFGTHSKLSNFWVGSDSLWVESLVNTFFCFRHVEGQTGNRLGAQTPHTTDFLRCKKCERAFSPQCMFVLMHLYAPCSNI